MNQDWLVSAPAPELLISHILKLLKIVSLTWVVSLQDDMIWNEDGSNWDDTDMGTWSDTAQENNSSWSSAAGWKKDKNKNIKVVKTYMLLIHFHTSIVRISTV